MGIANRSAGEVLEVVAGHVAEALPQGDLSPPPKGVKASDVSHCLRDSRGAARRSSRQAAGAAPTVALAHAHRKRDGLLSEHEAAASRLLARDRWKFEVLNGRRAQGRTGKQHRILPGRRRSGRPVARRTRARRRTETMRADDRADPTACTRRYPRGSTNDSATEGGPARCSTTSTPSSSGRTFVTSVRSATRSRSRRRSLRAPDSGRDAIATDAFRCTSNPA